MFTLFLAVLGRFLSDEIKAWSGWLSKKIRGIAVTRLPENLRERYQEEWEGGIEEIPGEIFRLLYSVGLLKAASGIRHSARANSVISETSLPFSKRLMDVALASVVLVFYAPFLTLVALAIKLESPGPVFIRLPRLGSGRRTFGRLVFRTMTNEGAELRMTRLGRLLCKTALDQLPVFFNVLRGDMSIVGPPPIQPFNMIDAASSPPTPFTPGIVNYDADFSAQEWSVWRDLSTMTRVVSRTLILQMKKVPESVDTSQLEP
ncbi:sugar transferase [Occallatibacter savannae]|uniref:sugar transferase n=1 Tax=Occallatibacter savannae TaxID=1002691 RepID=UPI0013A550F8|nr:sugar transferase [Occallatibacter savannae]